MSEPEPVYLRVIKHPVFVGAVGICAAGAAGTVVMSQVQKKQTEQMRSLLSSKSGVGIDASILDEASPLSPHCYMLSSHCYMPLSLTRRVLSHLIATVQAFVRYLS